MKPRKYRIKKYQREDVDTWLNTQYMDVAPRINVYAVQMRVMWFWVTIKEFDDDSDWGAIRVLKTSWTNSTKKHYKPHKQKRLW